MPNDGDIVAELISGDLRLSFVWSDDRLNHTLTDGVASLGSVESPVCETPVYAELHRQGDLVFLSGMSGDRHWSASLEPVEGGFVFDVACRAKAPADRLGVAYGGGGPFEVASDEASVSANAGVTVLTIEPPAGGPPYTLRCRYRVGRPSGS